MNIFYFSIFVFGLVVGSFLNSILWRLEKERSFWGRSYCPKCKHKLNWYDLVPIFSFLLLEGKCRYCHKKISWQYPLVEILTGLIFLLIFNYQFPIFNEFSIYQFLNLLFLFYIASSLIIILIYDLKHYIIPDIVLFPAILIAFIYRTFENLVQWSLIDNWSLKIDNFTILGNYLLASIIASAFFLLIYLVSKGEWMGFGDVKLAILLGLILGFPSIILGVFFGFLFGAIIGGILIVLNKKGLKSQIPFAPFLITGTFVAMFWGNNIINWYVNLIRIW
jgi:prepilin signal peptidase PulO-like enzyme (type II secretory pathway)